MGLLVAAAAVAVVVVLMTRTRQLTPFMVDSTAPEGYAAIAELWEDQGAEVRARPSSSLLESDADEPAERVVVVPVPGFASEDELAELHRLAEQGATVVLGEPWPLVGGDAGGELWDEVVGDLPFEDIVGSYSARELADTPAVPREPGDCDIPGIAALGAIDVAFAWDFPARAGDQVCYGDAAESVVVPGEELVVLSARQVGSGRVVTLGSPYLWVNARLQPAKEDGGRPLANAATALVLTGAAPGVQIDVIDPLPSGTRPSRGPRARSS